jgi:acyl-CoA synthetase (AMP-forming)/AMP-acid ligase II
MPGMQVRILGPDGATLPPGEDGEVAILTPTRMREYLDDPLATAATVDADGWIHTGDVGRLDPEGFLTLLDRKDDMIVRGGFNVYPAEVEAALVAHPDVAEAAVVGVPHRVLGEDVQAWVVLRDGASAGAAELSAFSRERIADFKAPRDVRFIDALPRNAMGKVLRRELRGRAGKDAVAPGGPRAS